MTDPAEFQPVEIDSIRPHSARLWNYWIGGKDNYEIDRVVGDKIAEAMPSIRDVARHSRQCLGRMVRHLTAEEGVRQFLDIGTGLPSDNNTHDVAQRIAPDCKVVYVDNDPLVLVHAKALLTSTPEGRCGYIDSDVRDVDQIVDQAHQTLDFSQPIGLILFGIMGNVGDDDQASAIVRSLVDALPSGSFLAFNDGTAQIDVRGRHEANRIAVQYGGAPYTARTPEQITDFFQGLELLEPGVVSTSRWRPKHTAFGTPPEIDATCALARKP